MCGVGVRLALAILAAVAIGCDVSPPAPAVTTTPPSPSIALAPRPSGVVDPAPLVARVLEMRANVLRADRVGAKLVTWDVFVKDAGAVGPSPDATVWAVAVLGSIRIDSLIDLAPAECGVYAFDARTGEMRSFRAGPAAVCAPYLDR